MKHALITRRTAALGAAVALATALGAGHATAGNATGSADTAGESAADLSAFEGTTVGIVSLAPGLEPVDRIGAGVEECVAANGGTTQVFDAKGGAEAVLAFEQANAAGVDAIYNIANDVSGGGLDAGLAEAAAAGRPVVTAWGGQRTGTYAITGLEFQSAARVGQYVIDRLAAQNDGVAAGTVLVVNSRVTPSLRQRADAFKAMVGPDTEFPDIEIQEIEVDIANALADAQAKVEQAIQADPEIDAVYASFDTIGQGAATAIDSAGGSQFVVSFNGDSTALDMIRQNKSFAATAANDLEGTAALACELLAELLAGGTPGATTYWMDSPLVTQENIPDEGFVTGAGAFELYEG
ncbi:sugar ABC transporter substrate-binding protein [Desertimonas flava]|uniref:sugar ABC transporter substrate-binding protein n=1 Tax=Desertimonas flava TaxID=2064846 RepID=UPI000E357458|nr:sugar ABC transporter substrate-binding protein [Desertimonas flava]